MGEGQDDKMTHQSGPELSATEKKLEDETTIITTTTTTTTTTTKQLEDLSMVTK
jgi:hypothetical protein